MIAARSMGTKNGKNANKDRKASTEMTLEERSEIMNSKIDQMIADFYNPHIDVDNYADSPDVIKLYVTLAARLNKISSSSWFNGFIIGCICVAGVLVGIQTYESLSDNTILLALDNVILVIFSTECVIKIIAEGTAPHRYFIGREWRWNVFDFVIVVLCLPIWGSAFGGAALLRMMRLMRVMKIVRKIPQLHMIIMGLIGGLKSIGYILLLLLLVFYLYAIAGIYAFRQNDPWHFGNLFIAMNTLFRLSTLEDWTDVMYINYFGCDGYDAGMYVLHHNNTQLQCNASQIYDGMTSSEIETSRTMSKFLSAFYFVTFIVVSALVMLSLFVGTITMSMTESMHRMKFEAEELERRELIEKARYRAGQMVGGDISCMDRGGEKSNGSETIDTEHLSRDEIRDRIKIQHAMAKVWTDVDLNKLTFVDAGNQELTHPLSLAYYHLAQHCHKLIDDPRFSGFITYVILLAGVVVGLQTDELVLETMGNELAIVDGLILSIFSVEVVLKFIAQDFRPWIYFRSHWNTFDLCIVVGSFLPGSGSLLTVLRLLRLLRVLKLVKHLPQLKVIVSALIKGLGSIGYIGIIMVLVYYVFSILGIILFRDNDPWHFGTLHFSMLTLFRCSTLEDWTDVLYINMYGCDSYGYEDYKRFGYTCTHGPQPVLSCLYFCTFIVVGALVLITLFIGVVTTSMEVATDEMNAEKDLLDRVERMRVKFELDVEDIEQFTVVFKILDCDGSGQVDEEELRIGLASIGHRISKAEIKAMLMSIDEDGSGEIDLAEFVQFMSTQKQNSDQKQKKEAEALSSVNEEVGRRPSLMRSDTVDILDDIESSSRVENTTTGTRALGSADYVIEDLDREGHRTKKTTTPASAKAYKVAPTHQ